MELDKAREAALQFGSREGKIILLKTGHIHDSYIAHLPDSRILLQRLNDFVFKSPTVVMRNLRVVLDHLRRKALAEELDPSRHVLTIVSTPTGSDSWIDSDGKTWRAFEFIESTLTLHSRPSLETIRETARKFGEFQRQLLDLDAELEPTIPRFHDLESRFLTFQEVLQSARRERVARSGNAVETILSRASGWVAQDRERQANVPLRLVHNDAKLDNVLFDYETLRPLCIVDLDTVMKGQVGNDLADLIRTVAVSDPSDDRPGEFDEKAVSAILEGYLEAADFLTTEELEDLVPATKLMVFELAIRFATDYLAGDVYFRTNRPEHNLDRCLKQLGLLDCVLAVEPWIESEIQRLAG